MDAKKIFAGALIACLLVLGIAAGVSWLMDGTMQDYSSIHTTAYTTESNEPVTITAAETSEKETETEKRQEAAEVMPTSAVKETTSAQPVYQLTIASKVFADGRIVIEYPIVSGMEDTELQAKINQNLSGNATAILSLYPVSLEQDSLQIKCTENYIDRRRVSVIYTGTLIKGTEEAGTSSAENQDGSDIAPGETWGAPGSGTVLPENLQTTAAVSEPYGDSVHIFYTNTINLKTGSSMSLQEFIDPKTLAAYIKDESCIFESNDAERISKVRTELAAQENTVYEAVFRNADFPLKQTGWPQSFCYENKGDIVFSIPVSHDLGDYILARYVPKTK